MALHNLKIVVVDGGRNNSYKSKNAGLKNSANDKTEYKDTPLYKMLNAKQTIKNKIQSGMSPADVFAMDMGTRVAGQLIRQTANYYLSDIGRKNGDSNYQAIVNAEIESITKPLSIVGSALSGAAAGSMFGPIGAGVGAVVGALSSTISLGFSYASENRQYQQDRFAERNSQAYNLARANYSLTTGRSR